MDAHVELFYKLAIVFGVLQVWQCGKIIMTDNIYLSWRITQVVKVCLVDWPKLFFMFLTLSCSLFIFLAMSVLYLHSRFLVLGDGSVYIWNVSTRAVHSVLAGPVSAVYAVSWHPTGAYLLSANKMKTCAVWADQWKKTGQTFSEHSFHNCGNIYKLPGPSRTLVSLP